MAASVPEPTAATEPLPDMFPVKLKLAEPPSCTLLEPVNVNAFPTKSAGPPAVVVIVALDNVSDEPLRVNAAF